MKEIFDIKGWRIVILLVIVGMLWYLGVGSRQMFLSSAMKEPPDEGSFSIVKDIKGEEPYITIKMKCYYHDNQTYGVAWQQLLNNTKCHQQLFDKCFTERSIVGRHETHVLTFHRIQDIRRCVCTDVSEWYVNSCLRSKDVHCCLDRGVNSVKCYSVT
eukprot:TCONS_00057775-protein